MDLRKYEATDEDGNPFVFTEQAKKYTWGVNFLNTEKTSKIKGINTMGVSMDTTVVDGTGVRNTAILRLKYEINDVVKNAYAVDVPTGDFEGSYAGIDTPSPSIEEIFEKIISIILLIVLIVVVVNVIIPVGMPLFKLVVNIVSAIITAIVSIVTFPFRAITRKRR